MMCTILDFDWFFTNWCLCRSEIKNGHHHSN